ncbi:NADH/Ubiquinone/plastoquinone (complex I) [Staphylothermus marinus F1]|uniref:NADH/Ubiquinone/plastoquinone (Complex I) n=1 Tax=Staphylothermus marinus (strain ATCC 43588 / DSM 3639 / JCM 9404 / F1) TaxID=399550 RepID=A3DNE5_STAMF|nr:proton-conducting transporter membrane subunit [Staphylothermus marinus]ABN70155.1 NADH/Ubiquinone/plastoquinone (complex I) [Staphylothermus marinus F1]
MIITMMIIYVIFMILSISVIYLPVRKRSLLVFLRVIAYVLPAILSLLGLFDPISFVFIAVAIPVGLLVSLYNLWYAGSKYDRSWDLVRLLDLFNITIIYTFLAPNLLLFISIWTITEIIGFLLVSFEGGDEAFRAGYRFFFLKSLAFELSALSILAILSQNISIIDSLILPFNELPKTYLDLIQALLVTLGFITTSAIVPLHFWLPNAHSIAPSSASSVLSGLTVKMGFYGLIRITSFLRLPISYWWILLSLSILTSIYGFTVLLVQKDIKRLLAYSTIGNTGFIAALLSIYAISHNNLLYTATMLNIYAHAIYKAALFINTGTIVMLAHTRNIERLSGLVAFTPYSSMGVLFNILSVIGVPPTIGFIGKLVAVVALLIVNDLALKMLGLLTIVYAILISIIYGYRILSIHWRVTSIEFSASYIPLYPQIIELIMGSLGIIYGLIIFLLFNVGMLLILSIVNVFALLLVAVLIAVFYYNIRARIMREVSTS